MTLDGNQSAGALVFDASGTNGYTLAQGTGGGALTLGTSAGASIAVVSGTHTISAPIVLAGSLAVSMSAGGSLDISGSVSQATGDIGGAQPERRRAVDPQRHGQLHRRHDGQRRDAGRGWTAASLPDGSALTVGSGAALIFGQPLATAPWNPAG